MTPLFPFFPACIKVVCVVSHLPLDVVVKPCAVGGGSPAQDVSVVHGVKPHLARRSEHRWI